MSKLACCQINLNHCKATNIILAVEVETLGCFVILIQEPWVFKNRIGGLPTDWRVHRDTFSNGPRACIASCPGLPGLLLSQFTSHDSAAILIESGCRSEPNIVLASFYMTHDSSIPPPLLGELITFKFYVIFRVKGGRFIRNTKVVDWSLFRSELSRLLPTVCVCRQSLELNTWSLPRCLAFKKTDQHT